MEETLNESITEQTSISGSATENNENSFAGGRANNFGDPLAPAEGYNYDFGEDSGLPMRTPFDQLLEFEEFDNLGDLFGDLDPSDNPFADDVAASTGGSSIPDGIQPGAEGDSASESNSNNPFDSYNPDTDGSPFTDSDNVAEETVDSAEEMPFNEGGSMANAGFSGIDNGAGNTDNGNGNNFFGDNNIADGNGNWSFGDSNQINGNGNWNLNEEGGTPFDSIFAGENNPLTGGNPLNVGSEGGIPADALGGNNPIFAGGSTTPTPVSESEIPDTAENPTGNQNTVNGNGNWNFGSDNNISGNGNWNFGDGNVVTDGNGNWNLGDNNEVSGNGNRPSGNDNIISGNSNRVAGDGNSINGNRFNLDEDDSNVFGNGDRYFQTDADGNVSLVSDESASDPNFIFDFDQVVQASSDSEVEDDTAGQDVIEQVYSSLNSSDTSSLPNSNSSGAEGFGGEFPTNDSAESDAPSGGFGGGGNPFSGGTGGFGGGENPFSGGASGFDGNASQNTTDSANPPEDTQQSGEDLNELLAASPFGRLLDIPGVEGAEDIFGNLGGSNPFGGNDSAMGGSEGGIPNGNPFANFNPLEDGNPFIEGDEPDVSFNAEGFGREVLTNDNGESDTSSSSFGGSGNPFSGGNFGGAGGSEGNASGFPDEGVFAIGEAGEYLVRDENSEWFISNDETASEDDTSLTNLEITGVDSEVGGNPFGGNPFEFDPTVNMPDSSDVPAGSIFPVGEVPEDLSKEELAVSSEVADSEDAPGEDSSFSEDSPLEFEYNYHWDFDFDEGDSENQDSSLPLGNSPPIVESPVFDPESNEIQLPNGATINPFNEDGESDLSIDAPVVNEDGLMIGELNISFPEYIEDYFSSVFNLDEVQEFNSNGGFDFDLEDNFNNLLGVDAPILGEDNVLQLPGGFEIDLSGIMNDLADSAT